MLSWLDVFPPHFQLLLSGTGGRRAGPPSRAGPGQLVQAPLPQRGLGQIKEPARARVCVTPIAGIVTGYRGIKSRARRNTIIVVTSQSMVPVFRLPAANYRNPGNRKCMRPEAML